MAVEVGERRPDNPYSPASPASVDYGQGREMGTTIRLFSSISSSLLRSRSTAAVLLTAGFQSAFQKHLWAISHAPEVAHGVTVEVWRGIAGSALPTVLRF
jgi:hypothetical protein